MNMFIIDELRVVKDRKYGNENPNVTGGWDGIIGELVRRVSEPLYKTTKIQKERNGAVVHVDIAGLESYVIMHNKTKKGNGCRSGGYDDHIGERKGRGFQRPFHGARHKHHDQEAHEAEAGIPLFYVSIGDGGVGRSGCHLPLRLLDPLCRSPLEQIRMEDRSQVSFRQRESQRLYARQFSLVHSGLFTTSWQRHYPKVLHKNVVKNVQIKPYTLVNIDMKRRCQDSNFI